MKPLFLCFLLFSIMACGQKKEYKSPPGYDLLRPEKFVMPGVLQEISGIALNNGNASVLFAHQDEDGTLFYFRPGSKIIKHTRFAKKGDYEDVAILRGYVIVLRSDGVLFTFPLHEVSQERIKNVIEWKQLVPPGEYEGLAVNPKSNQVAVLCKQCKDDHAEKKTSGTLLQLSQNGALTPSRSFEISTHEIEKHAGIKKLNFKPSALTQNPVTGEWYILSSVNKMLVITDPTWSVKAVYILKPSLFIQPEGIAFDQQNNLYIANEGRDGSPGTILKFKKN